MSEHPKLCAFYLEDELWGIDVKDVQEVLRYQEMTPVPLAPPIIGGLINLRGQIVTAIDLRQRLGLKPRAAGEQPMNVVLREENGTISLLVDEIAGVMELADEAFEEPPATLRGPWQGLIEGVYKLPDGLILVLNAESMADVAADVAKSAGERRTEGALRCVRS